MTTQAGQSFRPSLVWTGSEFALSWNDDVSGDHEIYLVRLSATGANLGTTPVTSAAGPSLFSSLAWTGTGFGVAWNDGRDPAGVYFVGLDASGAKIGNEKLVTPTAGVGGQRSLAWTGSDFVLSTEQKVGGAFDVFLARLDRDGVALAAPVPVSNAAGASLESALAPAAGAVGVAWVDERDGALAPYAGIVCR